MIPVNSLIRHIQPFQEVLVETASEVVRSGYFVLGPAVANFEREFSSYCGVEHCIGVANGTDAIELSLRALDVGTGDEVVVAANAAMYSTSAVLACGATPVFVDINDADASLDVVKLEEALRANPGIKVVVVTHLYGQLANIDEIVRMCKSRGTKVLEDCAQSHGARDSNGRMAGSFGEIASFSFYPTKNLGALGDGGAVVTRDETLALRVRQLRQYGWSSKYTNALPGGRNSRLDEIQARMLSVMLPHLDSWNTRRREIAATYSKEIRNPAIIVPAVGDNGYVAHLYIIKCDSRDALRKHLLTHGVETDVHYPIPDYRQPCMIARFGGVVLPVTERHADSVLTLPCFPELTDTEVRQVIDACNRF